MALRSVTRRIGSKIFPMFSSANHLHSHATSFGFKEVPEEEKSRLVGNVFSNVASNYDVMNDLMSAGLHRLWKDRLVSELNPFPGMKHLDVAGGTGDVAFRILESINNVKRRERQDVREDDSQEQTQIYVCDINPHMLNIGKKRAIEMGLGEERSLIWEEGDAEALSFQDNSMDGYTIAFGIRNVTHIEKVLDEAYRVLRRGGRFLCLELSHVEAPVFKELYDYYSFSIIPAVGELVAGDRESYQYLVESIRRFPPQEKFASMIVDAGFEKVEYENLVGGVVAIHSGLKAALAGKLSRHSPVNMLVPKTNRIAVYSYLFKEGVMVAKKDFSLPKHEAVDVPNLQVIKLMQSLKSRGYVKETFNWQWFYWYLTNEGIEYLRSYLHLPAEIVPATLKKQAARPSRPQAPSAGGFGRGRFDKEKGVGPSGDFNPEFRRGGQDGYRREASN